MKIKGAYNVIELLHDYAIKDRHPDITDAECAVLFKIIEDAGMRIEGYKPLKDRILGDMVSVDIHYKLPHIFTDDNGTKFCVGVYKRNIKPECINDCIAHLVISKTYMREKTDPEDDWRVHMSITLQPVGHVWPYRRKEPIIGRMPAGMGMIYRYIHSIVDVKDELQRNILKLKSYIDNGEPVIK